MPAVGVESQKLRCRSVEGPLYWVAVKELNSSRHNGETVSITIYTPLL